MTDLGPLEKTFRPTAAGTYNYLGAALLSVGGGSWLIHFGLTYRGGSLKSVVGGALCLLLGLWMVKEFNRLRQVKFELFTKGMSTSEGARFGWDEVVGLESRYVPGLRKTGIADDGNIASAYITTRTTRPVMLPRELGPGVLIELLALVSARTGVEVKKVLIANLTER